MGDEGEEEGQRKAKRKESPKSGQVGPTPREGSGVRGRRIGGKWCGSYSTGGAKGVWGSADPLQKTVEGRAEPRTELG